MWFFFDDSCVKGVQWGNWARVRVGLGLWQGDAKI